MLAKLYTPAAMAFAILTVSASPLETSLQDAPPASNGTVGHTDDNYGCNHLSSPADTWPVINTPAPEREAGVCYSAPEGVNWNRVEIMGISFPDAGSLGIQTFCHINCASSSTGKQKNTNCAVPVDGCAIGSFRVN
ncbi:hypothetical protein GGR58DRAFT_506555 [Xylaria digitata]|nr:hypothetical protein GGR58DRAFT_506555 [Xylaria digitata]